ncbi:ferric reductase-like transmembrane domain-containing protein [Candidatus Gracilibacteria bacterium]|nr:ferric reductase-like transmembrane domain-containing protein [Candidatus Gracilibacteria bacterium]
MNKIIRYVSGVIILLLLGVIFLKTNHKGDYVVPFGLSAVLFLVLVMYVRPLKDLFPKVDLFQFGNENRRYLGWLMAIFAIIHGVLKVLQFKGFTPNKSWGEIVNLPFVSDYTGFIFWGIISAIVLVPIFLTSNSLAVQKLGKKWKLTQRLTYLLMVTVTIHLFLNPSMLSFVPLTIFILWLILWILAYFKSKKKV